MFLHAGPFHLFFNMWALLNLGILAECGLGKSAFLLTYAVSGLYSSIAGEIWHPTSVIVGASGAIFGVVGLLLPLLMSGKLTVKLGMRTYSVVSILAFVVFNLAIGAITPHTDNAAHLGGLAGGLLLGGGLMVTIRPRTLELLSDGIVRKRYSVPPLRPR